MLVGSTAVVGLLVVLGAAFVLGEVLGAAFGVFVVAVRGATGSVSEVLRDDAESDVRGALPLV